MLRDACPALLLLVTLGCYPTYSGDIQAPDMSLVRPAHHDTLTTLATSCVTHLNQARRTGQRAREYGWYRDALLGVGLVASPAVAKINPEGARVNVGIGISAVNGLVALLWKKDDAAIDREAKSAAVWDTVLVKYADAGAHAGDTLSVNALRNVLFRCGNAANSGIGLNTRIF